MEGEPGFLAGALVVGAAFVGAALSEDVFADCDDAPDASLELEPVVLASLEVAPFVLASLFEEEVSEAAEVWLDFVDDVPAFSARKSVT